MVFQFSASQPPDLTVWPEPPIDDRSGPPLSQGVLFTMLAMVAADELEREWLDVFERLDPHAWYHGQLLESVLTGLERRDPALPRSLGRSVYLLFRARLESFGLTSAAAVIASLPLLWQQATRGDSGVFRSALLGPRHARVELEQPYNCAFEEGAVVGFIEAMGGRDVVVDHTTCIRSGAPHCELHLRWRE